MTPSRGPGTHPGCVKDQCEFKGFVNLSVPVGGMYTIKFSIFNLSLYIEVSYNVDFKTITVLRPPKKGGEFSLNLTLMCIKLLKLARHGKNSSLLYILISDLLFHQFNKHSHPYQMMRPNFWSVNEIVRI